MTHDGPAQTRPLIAGDHAAVSPVVVVTRTFTARPAAWVETRDFLRDTVGSMIGEDLYTQALQDAVAQALLASAHPDIGTFQIVVRILPDDVEIDILHEAPSSKDLRSSEQVLAVLPESFAAWLTDVLRREGLSQEAAARQLGVSVRTVSRWVRGQTEPRMKELRRVQTVFGGTPTNPR